VNFESVHPFINSNAPLLSVGFDSTIKQPRSQTFVPSSQVQQTEHFTSSIEFQSSNRLLSTEQYIDGVPPFYATQRSDDGELSGRW
jgi:hypothetical protein